MEGRASIRSSTGSVDSVFLLMWRLMPAFPYQLLRSLACHPGKAEVACGFQSGTLRIFDAGSAAWLQESRQHTGPVTQLAFARHGRLLLSLGEVQLGKPALAAVLMLNTVVGIALCWASVWLTSP